MNDFFHKAPNPRRDRRKPKPKPTKKKPPYKRSAPGAYSGDTADIVARIPVRE